LKENNKTIDTITHSANELF